MKARLVSDDDDEDEDRILQRYKAVVERKGNHAEEDGDLYGKGSAERSEESEEEDDDADEMDYVSSSQDEARQISSRITGNFAKGMLSKGSISPDALKMMAESAEQSDRLKPQTTGVLDIKEKLGLGSQAGSAVPKKEVFNANPMRGRKPLIAQDDEEDEEEDEEEDDKAKLLAWKKELEEKFKKFDSFKEVKLQNEAKQTEDKDEDSYHRSHQKTDYQYENSDLKGSANPMKVLGLQSQKPSEQRDSEISRPSTSIRIKDELMANKGSGVTRKPDSGLEGRLGFEKNNFFGGSSEEKVKHDPPFGQDRSKAVIQKVDQQPQTDALRQRVAELEAELTKHRRESEAAMKQVLENNQKTVQNTRSQYEREIDHLKEQLEEAYIQIKDLEKRSGRGNTFGSAAIQHKNVQTTDDPLEKNFLRLKELYDTLYKANVALVKDQKELQDKYTKLLKAHAKGTKTKEEAKPPIKIRQDSPLRQAKGSSSSK